MHLDPAALVAAQRFRQDFGLRSDEQWVRQVAADPASDDVSYSVPLTRAEVAELNGRMAALEPIRAFVVAYGQAHPDAWAGAYVDHARGGALVAQFSANVDEHRRALLARIRPGAPLEVRAARWSLGELDMFSESIARDQAWFDTIPAYLIGFGPDIAANRVSVIISSTAADVAARIVARYNWPPNVLALSSDGTGALLLPHGSLRITAVDAAGEPIAGAACVAHPDVEGAYEPRPVPMPTTDPAGVCTLTLPATGYRIDLEVGSGPPQVIGSGRVVVLGGELTETTITGK